MKKAWILSYPLSAQRRLWSDWADAQADLSLRWAQSHFAGFVMRRLKCLFREIYNWQHFFLEWFAMLPNHLNYTTTCQCSWIDRNYVYRQYLSRSTTKQKKMTYAPSEDSDNPGHPPSLIRVFAVYIKEPLVLNYPMSAQRRHRPDYVDAQAELSLFWAHVILFVLSCCGSFTGTLFRIR